MIAIATSLKQVLKVKSNRFFFVIGNIMRVKKTAIYVLSIFLLDLLQSFIKLSACPNDLLRSQGAMLKYLHIISSDLTQVYDAVKLRFVFRFLVIYKYSTDNQSLFCILNLSEKQ